MVLHYVAYFIFWIALIDDNWKWISGIIPLAFTAVTLKACIEIINETMKSEEYNLSKC